MKTVGIFLFDKVELLDFAGPYEVFSVANELSGFKLLHTFTVSESGKSIRSVHGLEIVADYSIDNCPPPDILVIPGGDGTKVLLDNHRVMNWFHEVYRRAEITFTVCSGARIPAKLGLLNHQPFTTHHLVVEDVLKIAPQAIFKTDERFVDNGKLMTAGGISAGIDISLYVLEKMFGKAVREATQKYMEYGDWAKYA
jgi:transcriptional regulator GlxA family with amidase domain